MKSGPLWVCQAARQKLLHSFAYGVFLSLLPRRPRSATCACAKLSVPPPVEPVQAILHDQDLMTFALILLERADQSLQHDVRDLLIGAARQEQDTRLYLPRMIPDDVLSEHFIARETLASRTPLNRPIHPRSRLHHPGQGRRCRLGERRKSCFAVHKDERIRHERRASNDALDRKSVV